MSLQTRVAFGFGSGALAVAMLGYITIAPPTPSVPNYGSGGSYQPTYHYWAYIDDEDEKLEEQRKKTEHAIFVREAAVKAITSNYNDISKQNKAKQNALALQKLKTIASDLEFKITAIDKVLLKMEMDKLRIEMDREDEESLLMLI